MNITFATTRNQLILYYWFFTVIKVLIKEIIYSMFWYLYWDYSNLWMIKTFVQ